MRTNARAAYLGPERRRPLVVAAGIEVFGERGYQATSMNDVAARAAVSKGVLYDCFPDGKAELFGACVREASARLQGMREQWTSAAAAGVAVPDLVLILAEGAATDPTGFAMLTSPRNGSTTGVGASPLVSMLFGDLRRASRPTEDARRSRMRIACLVALAKELAGADPADVAAVVFDGELPVSWREAVAG